LRIETELIDDRTAVCRVSGELDAFTAPDLRDALEEVLEAGQTWIIADLKQLTYLDSTGLGILVGTAKKCRQAGGDFAVASQRRNLLRIFQISGTEEILNVVADVEAARARLVDLDQERARNGGASGEDA
jgi:anti-sigma B factor antagonist